MKSINVYNALLAYRASKEAKWHDKNDVLTFENDGNTVKFPFYLLDDHIKRFEKLAIEENKPIKPANVPIWNKRSQALQNFYSHCTKLDAKQRKDFKKSLSKDTAPVYGMTRGGEYLTNKERISILELF